MDDHGFTILLTIIAGLWGMAFVVCEILKRLPAPRRRDTAFSNFPRRQEDE